MNNLLKSQQQILLGINKFTHQGKTCRCLIISEIIEQEINQASPEWLVNLGLEIKSTKLIPDEYFLLSDKTMKELMGEVDVNKMDNYSHLYPDGSIKIGYKNEFGADELISKGVKSAMR